jgi:hypothetical protein
MNGLLLALCVVAMWSFALALWEISAEADEHREQVDVVVGDFNRRKRGDEVKWQ